MWSPPIPAKAANLLKQTFLAKGAEVAVTRGTADHSVDSTTVLICGTLKHYRLALAQLHQQPWGLPSLANAVEKAFSDLQDELYKTYPQAPKSTDAQSVAAVAQSVVAEAIESGALAKPATEE